MKNNPEQLIPPEDKKETEQEKKVRLVLRYIDTKIIGQNESLREEEREIENYYERLSPQEKANLLYEKLMAYIADKQAEALRKREAEKNKEDIEPEKADPYLISEIKVLSADPETREVFSERYADARVENKRFRTSEIRGLWKSTDEEIKEKEERYKQIERDLHLKRVQGRGKISSAGSRLERLAENLTVLKRRKEEIETLQGYPKISENTDVAASFQYENLREYREQLDRGFVWLPSRNKIHQSTVSAILNHRWPVLIGEAGTGKSYQANAASLELTGHLPTEIECENSTGEHQLIKDIAIDPETGGSYEEYGPLKKAFTGYENSKQEEPAISVGRMARFDESGRLGLKGYSIIKKARQKKTGDDFYGHPVLPGAGAIWTTNPVGPRYPDRHDVDPAMRREIAKVYVDYPEMSIENPELYEFALTALLDENDHIRAYKEELGPAYRDVEIPEDQREILEDGSIVISKKELIENMSDTSHGALWRFAVAIRKLQDSFIHHNAEEERYPEDLLRFKEDADGDIEITTDGTGRPLTFSSSTVTLGELSSWMQGFNSRKEKLDPEFRVDTLTDWLNFKIKTYLEQSDEDDREKLRALFRHFGFLDRSVIPDLSKSKPLTPKEIGYLSPRIPRPVKVEKPTEEEPKEPPQETQKRPEIREYEENEIYLESGKRTWAESRKFVIENASYNYNLESGETEISPLEVNLGRRIRVSPQSVFSKDENGNIIVSFEPEQGRDLVFAGIIREEGSQYNNMPLGKSEEGIYQPLSPEELDKGIFVFETEELIENLQKEIPDLIRDYWEEECEGNQENNPNNTSAPL